jgi:lysophospholipase L1-like esterase
MPPATAPRFTLGRSLLFSTVLVVGFFAAAEALLRVVGVSGPVARPRLLVRQMDSDITLPFIREDRELFWSPKPGFLGEFRGKPVSISSLGLRGPEPALPKPAGRKRVVCFGDSITFGFAIGDEEAYPFQLGLLLAARNVDVVNAGVTGYTSHQVLGLLRRLAPRLEADVATVLIGWNDHNKRPATDREFERRLRASTAVDRTLDRLYVYKALRAAYLRTVLKELPDSAVTQRVPLAEYRENMAAIVAECRAARIVPVFVSLPMRKRPGDPPFATDHTRALAELAGQLSVPLLDVGELSRNAPVDANEADFIDLIHLSATGAQVMAHELARQLEDLGLI